MSKQVFCDEIYTAEGAKFQLKRLVMWPVFHLFLKPLIKRNYNLRYKSAITGDGKHPDQWYWADLMAMKHGYFVAHRPDKVQTMANIKAIELQKDLFFTGRDSAT